MSMPISLSPEFRKAFGKRLIPLATDCLEISQQLINQGQERIKLLRELDQKVCSAKEFEESLLVRIEVAKETISSCYAHVVETDIESDNYVSPLLRSLREQRDQSGYDRKWLPTGGIETWRYQINPAKRLTGYMFLNSLKFQAEIDEFRRLEKMASDLEREYIRKNGRTARILLSPPTASNIDAEVCHLFDSEVSQIGFRLSKKLSKPPNLRQYLMPLTDTMQLRLTFVLSASTFEARLYLVHKDLGRRFDGNWLEWYRASSAHEIRIWDIIPWFKYRFCDNTSAMLISFYAHLHALTITIDRIVKSALNSGSSQI